MLNREAGVILEGMCSAATSFYDRVFEGDWEKAVEYKPTWTYSSQDMSVMTNAASYPVVVPQSRAIPCAYVPQFEPISGVTVKKYTLARIMPEMS